MRIIFVAKFIVVASMLTAPQAQSQPNQTPTLPTSQIPDLGRPTELDEVVPFLDFGKYFSGEWSFTWDFPDSALGPAGNLTGKTTFKSINEKFFEAVTEATGAEGLVTIHETISYLKDNKAISRTVNDSRGFSYTQIGTVGGDMGGQFAIYYESAPFTYNDRTLRIRSAVRLLSPFNHRVKTTISEDGGPYLNHGNPWWKKTYPDPTVQ